MELIKIELPLAPTKMFRLFFSCFIHLSVLSNFKPFGIKQIIHSITSNENMHLLISHEKYLMLIEWACFSRPSICTHILGIANSQPLFVPFQIPIPNGFQWVRWSLFFVPGNNIFATLCALSITKTTATATSTTSDDEKVCIHPRFYYLFTRLFN